MKNIALITSTIAPDAGVFSLKRTNPKDRLEDYKKAFHFYCDQLKNGTFTNIVYVDNSDHNLDELINISIEKDVYSKVEFISYKSDINVKNSRFYLEINLIEYFFNNSKVIKENPSCMIWKITGRYLIKNISNIIQKCNIKKNFDFCINNRNYPYKVIDFYLVGFSLPAYKIIFSNNLNLYANSKDGEIILREYLNNNISRLNILQRFPVIPRIIGIRGFDGRQYGGLKDLTKFYLRSMTNIFFPSLWI